MKIHAFVDVYPHPFKPYFDTQFDDWLKAGHDLRVTSLSRFEVPAPLPVQTVDTLRTAMFSVCLKMVFAMLMRPRRSLAAFRSGRTLGERIKTLSLDAQLAGARPDVLFVHNLRTAVRFAYLKRVFRDVPLVMYYHGGELPGVPAVPEGESGRALSAFDLVFSNTRFSVDEIVRRGALCTHLIPVGLRLGAYPCPEGKVYRNGGILRLLGVGRAAPEKGFDLALRALASLRAEGLRDFTFTLVGDGPELPMLRRLASQLGLDSIVEFVGAVPNASIHQHMAHADALLMTSIPANTWQENQACVMQEAMLMGVLVIASDLGGVRESIPEAMRRFLFETGKHEQLARQIRSVMELPDSAIRELAEQGRGFVTSHYDSTRINAELLEIAVGADSR